ncbi:hypothetical protein LSUB1_G000229 [Lachnellula subtilissima]|uniref:Uncharacterized protein n=1 Tax=Lachnellula subtilissima TaxID=602034 RepID=A0A8H8S3D7_9HELO|nr:hypothetical protein LSUB1_G000229 [Lachnellula subtilissima]
MPPRRAKITLGESWVVEEEDEDEDEDHSPDYVPENDESEPRSRRSTPRRRARGANRSPEPELVMPSLDMNSLDGSWADTTSMGMRQTGNLSAERSRLPESRRRTSRQGPINGSPEKRSRTKPLFVHGATSSRSKPVRDNSNSVQNIFDITIDHTLNIMSWVLDVFGRALRILKTPISYLLAVWLLFGFGLVLRNLVTTSIYASLSPICRIPGTSLLNLPFCPVHSADNSNGPPPPVEFDRLMTVQANFEKVLEESAGGASLPVDMKRGEASIRDLRQLVRYSQLHSKDELVLEFDGFIETARIASYDLQKFNSHVGRAVDNVISTTRWTARVLDGIEERDGSRGSINSFVNDKLLAPFQPTKFTEQILLDQYIQHTRGVEEEIYRLIDQAQALLMILNNLEDRLEVIHGVATREDVSAKAQKEEILSSLWAMLGGHRGKLNKMDRQLTLLQQVGIYRKTAYAHVSGTILRLQAMGAGLEDLRERVGGPELLRDRRDIPLSVHIENIQRGVERLEEQRMNYRKLENENLKQTLERGLSDGSLIDG